MLIISYNVIILNINALCIMPFLSFCYFLQNKIIINSFRKLNVNHKLYLRGEVKWSHIHGCCGVHGRVSTQEHVHCLIMSICRGQVKRRPIIMLHCIQSLSETHTNMA